ncbi:MAG TPA: hypothetical protein VM487_06500 [Phycisphaerae bacterium]|nr:hypothetical protein [Phycisphaerae bacterium]
MWVATRKRGYGWSATVRAYVHARKLRHACRYIGCVEDSRDPANWCPRPPARWGERDPVPQDGDSIIVDVDPETTYPLTVTPGAIDTLWLFRGNVGRLTTVD